ncbi:hypothetical protein BJV77DRAFT_1066664 [Russula vinacea]|nr:hypothetical protein BJV77DRAFT_1066664 [Russula vinacea]
MFGESESESPRVPSPWDLVVTSASVDKLHYRQDELLLPKLSAEVEEGNVEYKLHLINPSSSRFARLVTQMKWRLLEGGGQAIYELGVADSGDLVGLLPGDLRATLDTLHAMAAEIGARVIISKEIEVTVTDISEAGFRAQVHRRHGSRDSRRTAAKEHNKAQTYPMVTESPRSFVSAASTSTPSSLDSTGSLIADSCSNDGIVHDDDSLLVFPMLSDCFPRCQMPNSHNGGEESFIIGNNHLDTIPEKSLTSVERGLDARDLHQVQLEGDVGPEPTGIGADELLLDALGKLGIAANPSVPEEPKRRIVEALIIRELDHGEGS